MRARAGRRYACWGCQPAPAPRTALQRTSVPHAPGQPWRMLRAWDSRCGAAAWAYATRALLPARANASSAQLWPPRASRPWYIHVTRRTWDTLPERENVQRSVCPPGHDPAYISLQTGLGTPNPRNLARQILWRLTRARCNAHGHVSARSTCSASACSRSRTSPGQVCVHDVSVGHHATAVLPAEPWRCAACTACARSSHGSAHAA